MERFALVGSLYEARRSGYSIFEIHKMTAKSAMGRFWIQDESGWRQSTETRIKLSDIAKTCSTIEVASALRGNILKIKEEREAAIKAADDGYQLKLNRLLNR